MRDGAPLHIFGSVKELLTNFFQNRVWKGNSMEQIGAVQPEIARITYTMNLYLK